MARQFEICDGKIHPVYANTIPQGVWGKIEQFQERIKVLYKRKQNGRFGIKSLGNEIRMDSEINEIFENTDNGLIVKSTRNRSEIEKLHVSSVAKCLNKGLEDIYYIMLSSDLRQSSQIFDSTSMNIENWMIAIDGLYYAFESKFKLNIYFVEIDEFSGCYFERHPNNNAYSRLIETTDA
jgi:hypothetical protein